MKISTYQLLLITGFINAFLFSCSENRDLDYYVDDYYLENDDGYDGDYCATVEYYNPNTGTRSTYNLNVEVEDNELVRINWANGGWLDDDHFYPEELDEGGWCEFESDKGYEYEVQIDGPPCSWTDESRAERDAEEDERKYECPNCYTKIGKYDEYCSSCIDKMEHTCQRCGQYDAFLFHPTDNCSDCKEEIENTCTSCGRYESGIYGGECSDCSGSDEYY